jgi:hypothetical protein
MMAEGNRFVVRFAVHGSVLRSEQDGGLKTAEQPPNRPSIDLAI